LLRCALRRGVHQGVELHPPSFYALNDVVATTIISVVLFWLYTFYSGPGLSLSQSNIPLLPSITKAAGITASVFLVLHEFKVHTWIADKICGFISGVDRDSVLASDISRIFGNINLADNGILYFTSTLIYLPAVTAIK